MKKLLLILILLFSISTILSAQTVNGDTLTYDGKKILKIWGTHQERGYAYGFLMGDEIKEIAEDYIIGYVFNNSSYLYENFRSYILEHFAIEGKYHTETDAMVSGIIDSGVDIYSSVLNRELDNFDILCANCIVDMSGMNMFNPDIDFGCSSHSSWGESTLVDPNLFGALVITRNMDWTPHETLLANHLLIVNFPSEEDEVPWLSFTFPGMIGALSAINQNGIAAFMNMGNIDTSVYEENLHPVFLSIRNGIEMNDYDNNSINDQFDVYQSIEDNLHLSGSIIHCVNSESGIVIECNNVLGTVYRDETDNTVIPENNLAATNHFRELYAPAYCYRYDNISDSLNADPNISLERSWDLLSGAAGVTTNLHTIQFAPSLNLIKWSTAKPNYPAYTLPPAVFDTEELFTPATAVDPEISSSGLVLKSYPNPFHTETTISFQISNEQNKQNEQIKLDIYNIKGQKIRTFSNQQIKKSSNRQIIWDGKDEKGEWVSSGIYLLKFQSYGFQKIKKILSIK